MKYLILLILIITTTLGFGQSYPRGLPSPSSNGYSKVGYSRQDSGMIMSARDTFSAAYPTMILWSGDNRYWFTLGGGSRWNPVTPTNVLRGIYVGFGLTKINDSTVLVDSSLVATRFRVKKEIDSLSFIKVPYNGATSDVDLGNFKLNAQSIGIKGTNGSGHIGLKHQSSATTSSSNESNLYANNTGDLSWLNGGNYLTTFSTSANTQNRTYVFPNSSGVLISSNDTLFNNGYTTRARNKQGNDSIAALLVNYKTLGDSSFNTGYTTRVQTKRVIDSLSATKQPLENQRLSTTDNPTFGDITGTGIITLTNTGTSLTQWRAAYPIDASGRISVIDVGRSAGIWASYNDLNQRVGYIGDSADAMKYVAEIGTHNFNANVNVTADINAVNLNLTNKITADSLVIIGGTDSQILQAAGGVITAGTGITISSGTISATGSFAYNTIDPNGSGGQSYIPANYPAALLMGGLYGGYIAVTTGSYTVNGNYRFIELKTGASAVGISSTASGQEFYLVNTTGSAISISFTLKDLSGTTLTTVPANSSYHIFYNGTTYLKL